MSKSNFRFKRFTVNQDGCAMKVGTDGTLLGSWARGGKRVLDIGTGTGLIALMMAQRYDEAQVLAVDIDEGAVGQAKENVASSPFASRIEVRQMDVRQLNHVEPFDAMVCNPPFFSDALTCPDGQRSLARHTLTLRYSELMQSAFELLAPDGELSVVVPFDYRSRMDEAAALAGFFKSRECAVKTTPNKPPRRYLLAYRKHSCGQMEQTTEVLETAPGVRSAWYAALTNDFYL